MNNHFALAIDTSGRVGSVAVGSEGKVAYEMYFSDQMRHAAELFPTIVSLTEKAGKRADDITEVYITIGPGSFTGLRIAATAAKMMALACDVKIAVVSSLDCAAQNAFDYIAENCKDYIKTVAVVIDAKRGQFFLGLYKNKDGKWVKACNECMKTAEEIKDLIDSEAAMITGEGLKYYASKFEGNNVEFLPEKLWQIISSKVYEAGFMAARNDKFENAETLIPEYIRLSDAEENLINKKNQ